MALALPLAVITAQRVGAQGPKEAKENLLGAHVSEQYRSDLESVREKRYLGVLTSNNSFDYFIHQGRHAGYQYEMVKAFTVPLDRKYGQSNRALKIQFELLPVGSEQLIPMLLQMKPRTAHEPYIGVPQVRGGENAVNNIRAGMRYRWRCSP